MDMRYVTAFAFGAGDHDSLAAFAPPGGAGDTLANRQIVYGRLRPAGDMPLLNDGNGTTSQLRDFQLTLMQQWSQGQGTADWPPVAPTDLSPDGLTRAALENCVGAAFDPGIEAGGIPNSISITTLAFAEAFRLDPRKRAARRRDQGHGPALAGRLHAVRRAGVRRAERPGFVVAGRASDRGLPGR